VKKQINIINRKAKFQYELIEFYNAGIVLSGSEIKSIRNNKASISESFCKFNMDNELFILNMTIERYNYDKQIDHNRKESRKLLLNKKELKKLHKDLINTGLTIIPTKLYINNKGFAKIQIALAKGKKLYDKRENIKDRDNKRNLDRIKKNYNK
tara:strand:- start:4584 stop:5045 length:462 start_codon:yes stop_codon:yes gene_type:complete